MEKVDFEQLRLFDLAGKVVDLTVHFENWLLLIFLRHLA
jgi:hypothetical protein